VTARVETPGAWPDFFLAGAPKSGTTALHVALARHPQLYLSRVKEPKYFLTDGPPGTGGGPGDEKTWREQVWRTEDYRRLFADAPEGTLRGESTPFYLYDPAAHARIAERVPHAKLVVVLRDPVERAHSNWAHLWSAGLEPEGDFLRACALEQARVDAGWAYFWRYLDLGRYGRQLARLYETFPPERVLVLRYLELRSAPEKTLRRITDFLGVAADVLRDVPAENVTTQASDSPANRMLSRVLRRGERLERRYPALPLHRLNAALARHLQREQRTRSPLTADQRWALIPRIADDVALLEKVTGESFANWVDPHRSPHADLSRTGPIGTARNSIDRPLRD
jgi:Sulfotransferase family